MYLSRLLLSLRSRDTIRLLADCHQLHRAIMAGFPHVDSDTARRELGVLFRVETASSDGWVAVLVQSRTMPAWTFENRTVRIDPPTSLDPLLQGLSAGSRYRFRLRANPTRRVHERATLGADLRQLDRSGEWKAPESIPDEERTGIIRRTRPETPGSWRLRPDGKRIGKRVELRREEDRLLWLRRQGERCGFDLAKATLAPGIGGADSRQFTATRADPAPPLTGRLAGQQLDRRLTFSTALFEGELVVKDPDAVRSAIISGIGPGKAFGCGLLSIAPIQHM